ncbi:MAG: vWA domain-containing protein [Saprospiraceae bacterium]
MKEPLPPYIIPFDRLRFWNDFQKTNHLEGCTLIEYKTEEDEHPVWKLNLDVFSYKRIIKDAATKDLGITIGSENDFPQNEDLLHLFEDSFKASNNFWNVLRKSIKLDGFFVPAKEAGTLPKAQLGATVQLLRLKARHFPLVDWLRLVKEETLVNDHIKVPVPIIGAWYFFQYYITFVKKVAAETPVAFQRIKHLLYKEILADNFEQQLPTAQLLFLMMGACEAHYLNKKSAAFLERYLAKAHPMVQEHWTAFGSSYLHYIQQGFGGLALPKNIQTAQQLKQQFYAFSNNDLTFIQIQLILDSEVNSDYWKQLPVDLQNKYGADRSVSFSNRMKNLIGNVSILDRIQRLSEKAVALPRASLIPTTENWTKEDSLKWFELSDEEQQEFSNLIKKHFQSEVLEDLNMEIKNAQQYFYKSLLNRYTSPFLRWRVFPKETLPQWNIPAKSTTLELTSAFSQKQKEEREAEEKLRIQLIELSQINNLYKFQQFRSAHQNDFAFSYIQDQWLAALQNHTLRLENQRSYRIRRMKEFGLLGADEDPNATTETLLDEMLQIEKEVTPYISFVKNAFRSALPMRKTTGFNPYRHSHDGIEFDPTTIQDQNKWMTGEVMKTLETKIKKGDAIQINAFALDASGSMDHDRMRNLFKILYLLILGLEDRKTYDAVHFFNSDFMEAAGFTDQFTNRKMLYKVLKSISYVSRDKGVVYGGYGGTDISIGVKECHSQIKELSQKMEKLHPEMLHLKSIFVITDGRPSIGIVNYEQLNEFLNEKRSDGDVAIKGIYIKAPEGEEEGFDLNIYKHPGEGGWGFMESIFGKEEFVETDDFGEAVREFVYIMTKTYRSQRG